MQTKRNLSIPLWLAVGTILVLTLSCTSQPFPNQASSIKAKTSLLPKGFIAVTPAKSSHVIIGLTSIELDKGTPARVGVQVDRVVRDINDPDMWYGAKVSADAIPGVQINPVPYMEGERVRELIEWSGASIVPLGPAKAKKKADGNYYASDGKDSFPFQILPDKLDYPSVYFIKENGSDFALLPDTHGFNSVAGAAIEKKKSQGLDLAIACIDDPVKVDAAFYLAKNGIACYAPCDRYSSTLMTRLASEKSIGKIIGSAPIVKTEKGSRIGGRPIAISLSETLIAQTCDANYPHQYYDTPARYFRELRQTFGSAPKVVETWAIEGETWKLVREARDRSISIIAARIYTESDYKPLKAWMDESTDRRLILFHSAAYEFGSRMFAEFPTRVGFGDLYPVFTRRP